MADLISKSSLKVLEVLKAMKGRSLKGCSNGELAQATHESPANITRALNTLIEAGLVEKWSDGLFRYSNELLEIAYAHDIETNESIERTTQRRHQIIAGARSLIHG